MKIRQLLKEAGGITAAFAFGRFNPAHQGHIAVWQTVEKSGVKWYIGTNPTTIGPNDPLTFDQKKAWMEEIYPQIQGHIVPEQSVVTLAVKIYNDLGKNEDSTIGYVTDDTDWAWSGKLLNQYNGVEGKHGYYKFAQIVHIPSPRVSSATALRDAARADDKAAFYHASGTDPKLKVSGKTYFDTVAEACAKYPLPVKKAKKVKEQGVAEGMEAQLPQDTLDLIDEYIAKIEPTADRNKMIQDVVDGYIHTSELEYALQEGVAEAGEWTKLPNGNYRNMHTGVQQSKPPESKPVKPAVSHMYKVGWNDGVEDEYNDQHSNDPQYDAGFYAGLEHGMGPKGLGRSNPRRYNLDQGVAEGKKTQKNKYKYYDDDDTYNQQGTDDEGRNRKYRDDDDDGTYHQKGTHDEGNRRHKGVADGSEQIYNILALDKGNALKKPTKLKWKASSLEDIFDALSAQDWYPLEINGVEVIAGKRLKQGVAEEAQNKDMTGQTCEKCKKGKYQERSQYDDMEGKVTCKCGHRVNRWKNYKEQGVAEGETEYGPEWDEMVKRIGQRAKQGPLKTVYDEKTGKYKNVPVNEPKKDLAEMDSQGHTGSRDHKRTSKYGTRDDYNLSDPEITLGPDSISKPNDVAKKASAILSRELDKAYDKDDSAVIADMAKKLTNPPKVMQHRAQQDQKREEQLKYRDIAKRNESIDEANEKVHLRTPKHGMADHSGRDTGVSKFKFGQTPEENRCPKCNSLFKAHYRQHKEVEEASLSAMRDYFSGDGDGYDPLKITQMRQHYGKEGDVNSKRKEFRSEWEYQQWLKKQKLKPINKENIKEEQKQNWVQKVMERKK